MGSESKIAELSNMVPEMRLIDLSAHDLHGSPAAKGAEYRYGWTAARINHVFRRPLYRLLIATSAFQRLADIRFLGAIDYFIHPTGRQLHRRRHTRLEHTLGVAHLALMYCDFSRVSEKDEKLIVCAALLHDIGHAPLSHSLEFPFKKLFGADHHQAGARIIYGTAPNELGAPILTALTQESVDPDDVVALVEGKSSSPHNILFSHPINIDTMEAISRSETYIRPNPTSPTPDFVLSALLDPQTHVEKLDNFWRLKDQIYRVLINGPVGALADHISFTYVQNNSEEFSRDDFFVSERVLRRRHPGLFRLLEQSRRDLAQSGKTDAVASLIEVQQRRFYIEASFASGHPGRYRQNKTASIVALGDLERAACRDLPEIEGLPLI